MNLSPLLLVPAVLATSALAQAPKNDRARHRVLGQVKGLDGKAWAGAVVTLVGETGLS